MASSCKWAPYMLVRAFSVLKSNDHIYTGSFQCERFNLHTPRTWRTSCQSTRTPQTPPLSSSPFWAKPDLQRGELNCLFNLCKLFNVNFRSVFSQGWICKQAFWVLSSLFTLALQSQCQMYPGHLAKDGVAAKCSGFHHQSIIFFVFFFWIFAATPTLHPCFH